MKNPSDFQDANVEDRPFEQNQKPDCEAPLSWATGPHPSEDHDIARWEDEGGPACD